MGGIFGSSGTRTTTNTKPEHIVQAEKDALAMTNYLSKLGSFPSLSLKTN